MRNKKTELTKKFGWKVRIERTKKDMSQEKLAELANLSMITISLSLRFQAACFIMQLTEMHLAEIDLGEWDLRYGGGHGRYVQRTNNRIKGS